MNVVAKLPCLNLALLRYLVVFLKRVHDHSSINKMPASNLGIVLGPTLMSPRTPDLKKFHKQVRQQATVIELFILESQRFNRFVEHQT
jgi:vancomycin permeability regulator SanA